MSAPNDSQPNSPRRPREVSPGRRHRDAPEDQVERRRRQLLALFGRSPHSQNQSPARPRVRLPTEPLAVRTLPSPPPTLPPRPHPQAPILLSNVMLLREAYGHRSNLSLVDPVNLLSPGYPPVRPDPQALSQHVGEPPIIWRYGAPTGGAYTTRPSNARQTTGPRWMERRQNGIGGQASRTQPGRPRQQPGPNRPNRPSQRPRPNHRSRRFGPNRQPGRTRHRNHRRQNGRTRSHPNHQGGRNSRES